MSRGREAARREDAYAVFWTTTPWTVPTNFAIVVGADIDYVEVRPTEGKFAGKKFYLGKPLLGSYAKELGDNYEIVRELKGAEMEAGATTRCSRTSQATRTPSKARFRVRKLSVFYRDYRSIP